MYSKKHLWLIVLVSAVVIAAALYSQYVLKMDPCPLCIFQRVAVIFVGLFALLMAVLPQRKSGMGLFSAVLISIPALIGLASPYANATSKACRRQKCLLVAQAWIS